MGGVSVVEGQRSEVRSMKTFRSEDDTWQS